MLFKTNLSAIRVQKRYIYRSSSTKLKTSELDVADDSKYNDAVANAGVAELADAADLKSAGAILVGSSPTLGIKSGEYLEKTALA